MIRLHLLGGLRLETAAEGISISSTQPKRTALLAYLAVATPRGFHRRDCLLGLFWPEADEARARSALSNAVYHLRRALGEGVLLSRGNEEIGLAQERIWCDAVAFEQALEAGDATRALELYQGDLLTGFFISDAPEFERWLEKERQRLRQRAAEAAWTLAMRQEAEGDAAGATRWARRAWALSPDDEAGLRRMLTLFERGGDRAGAIRAYEDFARRMREEYELEPSEETTALVAALRARRPPESPPPAGSRIDDAGAEIPETVLETATLDESHPIAAPSTEHSFSDPYLPPEPSFRPGSDVTRGSPSRPGSRQVAAAALVGALILIAVLVSLQGWTGRARTVPVIAIGTLQGHGNGDPETTDLVPVLADLLATSLAQVPGLQVVSTARMYEIRARTGRDEADGGTTARAARRAGASELVEGVLYRRPDGSLRLDLRRIDLAGGAVRAAYSVESSDAFALVEDATAQLAEDLGLSPPQRRLREVTTTSFVARRLYEEGLQALVHGEAETAYRFFRAALAEDSTFAMAAYYASESKYRAGDGETGFAEIQRAVRLSDRATDRERLVIRARFAVERNEPALALAETLTVRYPAEAEGHYLLGFARYAAGDFLRAVSDLQGVVAMDSIGLANEPSHCRACSALHLMVGAYMHADSAAAAERTAREWTRLQPDSYLPWQQLAFVQGRTGRYAEALEAHRTAMRLGFPLKAGPLAHFDLALRAGEFTEADRLLQAQLPNAAPDQRSTYLWFYIISLRNQGRLREALEVATHFRELVGAPWPGEIPEAIIHFEMSRPREMARRFEAMARKPADGTLPIIARHQAWQLTLAATALAAAGDTTRLTQLADTIQTLGRRSAYWRDPRLHHHVRGLVHSARGRPAEAVVEFRRAIHSPTFGYTRTNLELGRALVRIGRPEEAVVILQSALRGSLEASNLYVTHTELREHLGYALEAAGQPDSAAVQYRRVLSAWRDADPQFHARRESVRQRLATVERRNPGRPR